MARLFATKRIVACRDIATRLPRLIRTVRRAWIAFCEAMAFCRRDGEDIWCRRRHIDCVVIPSSEGCPCGKILQIDVKSSRSGAMLLIEHETRQKMDHLHVGCGERISEVVEKS
jgi:hypothetical protein